MQVKEFHLIGTVQRQSVKLEVRPSDALDDLKCDLGGALGIWDPKGILERCQHCAPRIVNMARHIVPRI